MIKADFGVAGGGLLAQRLRLAVAGLGEPAGRPLQASGDEDVGLLVGDEAEREVAAGRDLRLDPVGDQPGEPGADRQRAGGQARFGGGEPAGGALAVDVQVKAYVPDGVHDAERTEGPGDVGGGLPGHVRAVVPHGRHRHPEGLEAHTRAAGVELQLGGEPGAGRDDPEGVGDAPGEPDGAPARLPVLRQLVAQEQLPDRPGVVAEFGDVQDPPGELPSSPGRPGARRTSRSVRRARRAARRPCRGW